MTFRVKDGLSVNGVLFVDTSTNVRSLTQIITSSADASSTNTGALRVTGGVGIGGGLVVGGIVTATSFVGAFAGTVSGNATSADKWSTARTITLGGDLSGSVSIDGSSNVTLTATIGADSIALGTDTTGNYVAGISAGTAISVAGSGAENATVTITNLGVGSIAGTAPINLSASTGSVTVSLNTGSTYVANAVNAEKWLTARTVTLGGDLSGSVSIDGSANVTLTATIAADSIALGTDTTGNYVATAAAGTGIAVAGSGVETAAITITNLGVTALTGGTGIATNGSTGSLTLTNVGVTSIAGTAPINLSASTGSVTVSLNTGSTYVANTVNAEKWLNARTITLGGDLSGSVSIDGSTNVTLTATIGADSVALGTDTTGNYVATGATSGFGISGSASSEGSTFTVTANSTSANTVSTIVFRDGNGDFSARTLTLTGDLVVQGTTVTVNSTVTNVSDPIITIGSGPNGAAPSADDNKDRGIAFQWHNGSSAKIGFFGYDDSTGYLTFVPDATITNEVVSGTVGTLDVTAITGSAAKWTTPRTFTFGGDLTGSMVVDGSQNVTFTATIAADSVALGTDTTGNYVAGISAGTAIAVAGSGAENATVTITNLGVGSIAGGTGIATNGSTGSITLTNVGVTSLAATGPVAVTASTGSVTVSLTTGSTYVANAVNAEKWLNARTITLGGDLSGSVSIDGSTNVTLTATIGADSVALGTDTTGNYVAGVSPGTGIVVAGSGAENATVTITNVGVTSLTGGGGVTVSGSTGSVTLGFTTSTLVQTASNLAGGSQGRIAYQSAAGTTAFANSGTTGQFLQATTNGAPVFTNTGSMYVADSVNAEKWKTARTLTLGGDLSGSVSIDGSSAITLTATIAADSVALGTDTTGNYVAGISAGTAIAVAGSGAENATVTITNLGVGSIAGTAPISLSASTGSVTVSLTTASTYVANAVNAEKWLTPRTFTFGGDLTGSMTVDGSQNVTFTATIAADSVALGTDTTGNYVAGISAGSAIAVAGSGAENATVTVTNLGVHSLTGGGGVTVSASTGSVTLGFTTSTLVQTASNIAGGSQGQIHYQSAAGTTAFANSGTTGQFLQATTNGAPVFTSTSSIYVNSAVNAETLRAGTAGQLVYQSAAGVTAFAGPGTAGQILVSAGTSAPTYTNTGSIYVGNATKVDTVAQTANANYFVTFVDTNNAAGAQEVVCTTSTFTINPATGAISGSSLTLTGNLVVQGTTFTVNSTVTNVSDPIITVGSGAAGAAPTADDNKDRGIAFQWHNGTSAKVGFFGYDDSTGYLTFVPDATITNEVVSGTQGDIQATNFRGTLVGSLSGGAAGNIVYQSAAGTTAYLTNGTAGQILLQGATNPTWTNTASVYVADSVNAERWKTTRTISLTGDVTGSANIDGTGNISIAATVAADSVALGTDTTGNYVASGATSGFGISGSASTEGSTFTVTANSTSANTVSTIVFRDGSGNFSAGTITASLTGNATGLSGTPNITVGTITSGAITSTAATGVLHRAAATQDGVEIRGRAGGTGNWEVILTPTTLSADRTLTLPDVSGTVVTTGDTGSVTSTMILDGTIVNADINASAAIAITKLAASTISGVSLGNNLNALTIGTGLSGGSYNGSAAVTITNLGVTSLTGTTNQITASASTGSVTLSLPQSINSTASVQFGSLGIGTAASGTTGEIRATNEITAYFSDRRLKENVVPLDGAVTKVLQLNGILYNPNELAASFGYDRNKKIVGLFADEVESVLPEAVRAAPFDLDEFGNSKSGENYKTVQYEKLVPLLVEAIKEQQQQIAQLYNIINTLANK